MSLREESEVASPVALFNLAASAASLVVRIEEDLDRKPGRAFGYRLLDHQNPITAALKAGSSSW
jgi:hypothetical protein